MRYFVLGKDKGSQFKSQISCKPATHLQLRIKTRRITPWITRDDVGECVAANLLRDAAMPDTLNDIGRIPQRIIGYGGAGIDVEPVIMEPPEARADDLGVLLTFLGKTPG